MDELREKIERIDSIRQRVAAVQAKKERAVDVYYAAIIQFDAELTELRFNCPHWLTKYHGDPAGGSDSFTVCEICGANL